MSVASAPAGATAVGISVVDPRRFSTVWKPIFHTVENPAGA